VLSSAPELVLRPGLDALGGGELEARGRELDVPPAMVALMYARGVTAVEAQRQWLSPRLGRLRPPTSMAGFEAALELLVEARVRGWRVGVFGDYDVDGVTTTSILAGYLEKVGLEVVARVARRGSGYGFTPGAAARFEEAGCDLVLTGDCGTSDHEALGYLADAGIPTVVIDHHMVPDVMPPAAALINPWQPGCDFPFKGLCSAGVAFYLCAALRTKLRQRMPSAPSPDPRWWLDLVALGTVCDMVPLTQENRILTHAGLTELSARRRPGVRAMLDQARVDGQVGLDESHAGFTLGPRLNAPGRLDSAEPALALLRARNDTEAAALAARVESFNVQRKAHQATIVAEALAKLSADPKSDARAGLVVADEGWLHGIVGIAANGVVERYGRPAAVVAVDRDSGEARGSVRSAGAVDVRAALAACEGLLLKFGGHQAAAGFSLRAEHVPAFVDAFDQAVAAQHTDGQHPRPGRVMHDGERPLSSVDEAFVAALRRIGPFGVGFEPPRFVAEVEVAHKRSIKGEHVALEVAQGETRREAIAFGESGEGIARGDRLGLLYVPEVRTFRGRTSLQLRVVQLWKPES